MQVKAKKSLGQNFLVNPHILDKIVAAAEITKDDTILEVGPGTGNLTKKIIDKAGRVLAVEKDSRLIEPLKKEFGIHPNIEITEADILSPDIISFITDRGLKDGNYKIVANIPYYITSHFLRTIFEKWPRPKLIVLTIQKEVAQRIVAKPPHTNLLALSIQYYSEPKIISYISKNNFRPVPKIDSAIIRLTPHQATGDSKLFELISMGFAEKRKQLVPVLSRKLKMDRHKLSEIFEKIGLVPTIRPENLSLAQWIELEKYLNI